MADETINVAVTDNGTIDEVATLLELLGLTGEQALQRLQSAYVNTSSAQAVAEASAKAFSSAAQAGFTNVTALGSALDKLTTSEQRAATTQDGLVKLTQSLAVAQQQGYAAALALARGTEAQVDASNSATGALNAQADATNNLSRLQQNLQAREQALAESYGSSADRLAAYNAALADHEATVAAVSAKYDAYTAARTLANAATQAAVASTTEATAATQGLATAQDDAEGAIARFLQLQQQANTTTIAGREATVEAAAAYREARDAIGAYAAECEIVATANDAVLSSALRAADSINAMDLALEKEAAAAAEASTATVSFSERIATVQAAGEKLYGTFGGLNALFAAAFTTASLVKADDEFVRIQATLGTVTTSSQQLNGVFNALLQTSNSTQTSIEQNVKLYSQFASALGGTTTTAGQLVQAIGGIDTALKLGNVSGQDAYRTMRSLSEIISGADTNSSRFFTNLQREAPVAFNLIKENASALGFTMADLGLKSDTTGTKIQALSAKLQSQQAAYDNAGNSVSKYSSGVTKSTNDIASAQTKIDALQGTLDKNSAAADAAGIKMEQLGQRTAQGGSAAVSAAAQIGTLQASTTKLQQSSAGAESQIAALRVGIQQSQTNLAAYQAGMANAAAATDQAKQATIAQTAAQLQSAQAAAQNGSAQEKLIATFIRIYQTSGDLAKNFTTVSGSLEVLKNNLIAFSGTSTTANVTMTLLKDTILLVASNLDILIPATLAFAAAIATVKVANVVSDLVSLTSSLISTAGAITAATVAAAPLIVTIGVITTAIVLWAQAIVAVINVFRPLNDQLSLAKIAMDGVNSTIGLVSTAFSGLSSKLVDAATKTTAEVTALKAVSDAGGNSNKALQDLLASLGKLPASDSAAAAGNTGLANSLNGVAGAANNAANAVARFSAAQRASTNSGGVAPQTSQQLNSGSSYSGGGTSQAGYTNLGNGLSLGGTGAGPGLDPGAVQVGAGRDGGRWVIPGGTGVDSRTIAVSPGEVVTVQTPAQFNAGVLPPYRARQTAFATGGVTTGAGVDLGLGVQLSTDPVSAIGDSVTGFQQASDPTTAANDNTQATTDNTSVVASNSTSVATNTAGVTAATAATIQLVTVSNQNAQLASDSAKTALSTTASNTSASDDNTAAVRSLSQNIVNAANAIVNAANAITTTLSSAANAISAAAQAISLAASSAASSGGGTVVAANDDGSAASSGTATTPAAGSFSYNGVSIGGTSGIGTYNGVSLTGPYTIGATGGSITQASQDSINLNAGGAFGDLVTQISSGGTIKTGIASNDYYNSSGTGLDNEDDAAIHKARDGADFFVPGSTGVDSRLLQLAVSPGESVAVRTPAQQRSGATTNHYAVTMNVSTPDAASFGKSYQQLEQGFSRGLRRIARK